MSGFLVMPRVARQPESDNRANALRTHDADLKKTRRVGTFLIRNSLIFRSVIQRQPDSNHHRSFLDIVVCPIV